MRSAHPAHHGGVTRVDSHPSPSIQGEGETPTHHEEVTPVDNHPSSSPALPAHGERETFDLANISGDEDMVEPQTSHPIAAEGTTELAPSPINSIVPTTKVKSQSDCNHFFENWQCIDLNSLVEKQMCKYC